MRRALAHAAEYALLRSAELAGGALAWERQVALGTRVGELWWLLDRRRRRVAQGNVRRAFPSWGRERVLRLVRDNFAHLGRSATEVLGLPRTSPEGLLARCRFEGIEHLQAALARGRGVLLLTAHLGNWELAGLALAARGIPFLAVGRTQSNPWVDRRAKELRERFGGVAVPHRGAVRPVLRGLQRGAVVGFLMDQRARGEEAVPSRFFGRTVATNAGLAAIALRTGSPVLPGFSVWDGSVHRLRFEPPLELLEGGSRTERMAKATEAFDASIEAAVRRNPEQWLWVHRRWKLPREWRR